MTSPERPTPKLSPEVCLAAANREQRKWELVAADSNLSPQAAEVAREAARSAKASVKLWKKGLAFEEQRDRAVLMATLGEDAISIPRLTAQSNKSSAPDQDEKVLELSVEQKKGTGRMGTNTDALSLARAEHQNSINQVTESKVSNHRKPIIDKILESFAAVWTILLVLYSFISISGLLLSAKSLWDGWSLVAEVWSPFNVPHTIVMLIFLSPGLGALWLLQKLQAPR